MDLNNKYKYTKSQFSKKAGLLSFYIADKLDNNSNIKRYLMYNTINPLGERGLENDKDEVYQAEIDYSLLDTHIFDSMFNDEMEVEKKSQIYIHSFNGRNKEDIGELKIYATVLVPRPFEQLINIGEKRSFAIAQEIEDALLNITLDSTNTDEYLLEQLGSLKFTLLAFENSRLSKTNDIIKHTMVFNVNLRTCRV